MTTETDLDRRSVERVRPDLTEGLEVTLDTADRTYFDGIVVNVSIGGACVRFRRDLGPIPNLTPGEVVSLSFSYSRSEMNIQVPAKVMARVNGQKYDDFRCVFDPGHISFLEEQLISDMFRLFNRRNGSRHTPKPDEPVVVALRISHDTDLLDMDVRLREVRDINATARLKDISANGIAIACDAELDQILSTTQYVEARFALPGLTGALYFVCKLLNRRPQGHWFYHGLSFEAEHTVEFTAQQKRVIEYVACI